MKRVNCTACKYYYVTWDSKFPKGCQAFRFKTSNLPSIDVFRSSGTDCLKFEDKRTNDKA